MLLLNVTLNEEDFVEFSYYTGWKAPWNKKKRTAYYLKLIVYSMVGIAVFLYLTKQKLSWYPLIALSLFLVIYFVAVIPTWVKYAYKRSVRKFISDPRNANIFSPTELQIGEKGILSKDPTSETLHSWTAFVRKSKNKSYTYLYLNSQLGLVIPDRMYSNQTERMEFEKLTAIQLPLQAQLPLTKNSS